MSTLSLFEPNEVAVSKGPSLADWREESSDSAGLRYYQREAVDASIDLLINGVMPACAVELNPGLELDGPLRAVMVEMATGLGKTQVFSALTKEWLDQMSRLVVGTPGRVLVLAHRKELVRQARNRLEQITCEQVDIEMAGEYASLRSRIVVASIQTIMMKKRLERFPRDHFTLIIMDEFHHYVSETYRRPPDWFETAKLFGVTATPDRADGKALGQLAQAVAYRKTVWDAINEGFLVPFQCEEVILEEVDLKNVDVTKKGDFDQDQLDAAMLKGAEGLCKELFARVPNEHTIVFCPGVATAHYCAAKLNEYRPGCAAAVDGETPPDQRDRILKDYAAGRIAFLTNCAVLTEGFDAPITNCVARANPTKSRARYAQEFGRGTRVLPGVIEDVQGKDFAEVRKQLIALSAKPFVKILDFTGDPGEHQLVGPEDILGGDYTAAEIKVSKKIRKETGELDAKKSLEQARKELRALAKAMDSKVKASSRPFDPFDAIRVSEGRESAYRLTHGHTPITANQRAALEKSGVDPKELEGKSKHEAQVMLQKIAERRKKGLASMKQLHHLNRFGVASANLTAKRASEALDYIAKCGWSSKRIDPHRLNAIVGGNQQRQPGDEG